MITIDQIPTQNHAVIGRIVNDEAVIVLPNKGQVKVLNEVGTCIWSLMDGARTVKDIIAVVNTEFAVSEDVAMSDTLDFINQLVEREMVTLK